jgi:starch-binding outer membrane protein, SusD/RagB family
MKSINLKHLYFFIGLLIAGFYFTGCTKLEEKVYGTKYIDSLAAAGSKAIPGQADLDGAYNGLNSFSDQANIYALQEHTTDEMMGPTRGTDWDDFGTWRKLHTHSWDASHNQIYNTWLNLNKANYSAYIIAEKATDLRIKAEASFLRAFFTFNLCDVFGQVPYRNVNDAVDVIPKVYSRKEVVDKIISDLNFAVLNLSPGTNPGVANKQVAQFLLAKVYLNKAVYTQDPKLPAGPFTFAKTDMDQVIQNANSIISSGNYSLAGAGKYWDNFKWDNSTVSTELVFVRKNDTVNQQANVRNRSYMGLHYNQKPGGWNGFTTLADFYKSFELNDIRRSDTLPGFTDKVGTPAGFLIGQQNDKNGNPIKDRSGNLLSFTPNVDLGFASEAQGIRVIKYPLDPDHIDGSGNDYIFFRYADVILMKAEAILRGGTDPNGETALTLVNNLRSLRGASLLTSVTLTNVLAERGRELYYEGWRRNDLIRFQKFNEPVDQRASASAGYRVVFPIPTRALSTNPNLKQNFGY